MDPRGWIVGVAWALSLAIGHVGPDQPLGSPGLSKTVRVSVSSEGKEARGPSWGGAISADGRYVAFSSWASDLVPGDTNVCPDPEDPESPFCGNDVFVHDRDADGDGVFDQAGGIKTVRVSVTSDGREGHGVYSGSYNPSISADGRFVAFQSDAPDLVQNDTNEAVDIFVHDRDRDGNGAFDEPGGIATLRVSISSEGVEHNGLFSREPDISADGRFVAFTTDGELVNDDTNGSADIYVHDLTKRMTERVSVNSQGEQAGWSDGADGASISGDGRYVAFYSDAPNLVEGDNNEGFDVFLHDRQTGHTERVSVSSQGVEGNDWSQQAAVSDDGRYVAFRSWATNLIGGDNNDWPDVFLRDRLSGRTTLVTVSSLGVQGDFGGGLEGITPDGRYVLIRSGSTNLSANCVGVFLNIYVHDTRTGRTTCASVGTAAHPAPGSSYNGGISADGTHVAYASDSPLLVPGRDLNQQPDVFVWTSRALTSN